MKHMVLKGIAAMLAVAALAGCRAQQQLRHLQEAHVRKHMEQCRHRYHIHQWFLQRRAPELKEKLQRAVRAQWEWSEECDNSAAHLLPKPLKLSKSEFDELVALWGQVQPMPALPQALFMTEPPPFKMPDKTPQPVVVSPDMGCCGGVDMALNLYDARGEYVCTLSNSSVVPASRVKEWDKTTDSSRPDMMLPDDVYRRLLNLPSTLKAKKWNDELHRKINHRH